MLELEDLLTEPNERLPIQASAKHRTKRRRKKVSRTDYLLVLLCLASALVAIYAWQNYNAKDSVVIATSDLQPGEVISSGTVEVIDAQLITGMIESTDAAIGSTVRYPISAGEPVLESAIGSGLELPENTVVVGILSRPGMYPTPQIAAGDRVDVLGVNPETGITEMIASNSQVFSVAATGFDETELLISVLVAPSASVKIANSLQQPDGVRLTVRSLGGN